MKIKRVIALLVAVVMLIMSMPLWVFATETKPTEPTLTEDAATDATETEKENLTIMQKIEKVQVEKKLTLSQAIEKVMSERTAIKKTRTGIDPNSTAAVYVDGVLSDQGGFRKMWRKALSLAPKVDDETTDEEIKAMKEVEFVLNKDVSFEMELSEYDNFENGAMYVAGQKVTIDLNGHLLYRKPESSVQADSVIWINDYSVVTIMDSSPDTEHKGKIKDHLWVPDDKGDVIIKGGIIAGGCARSRGGGIFINNDSTVYMTGGTVAGNDATAGSGIFVGDKCTLDMTEGRAQVCYNSCFGSLQDGGAIYISGANPVIKGGYIHNNWSEDYGAGIMADDHHFTIDGCVIYSNHAEEEGGGIYIGDERASASKIENCVIVGNYSGERGGGVYLWSHLDTTVMKNCVVEYNCSKEHGGGICVSKTADVDLTIEGKMIVRNNFKSAKSKMSTATDKSNLYLQGNDNLIVGDISDDSEIWIRTGKSADDHNGIDNHIIKNRVSFLPHCFYSDNTKYHVAYYTEDPNHDCFHRYYFKEGEKTEVYPTIKTLSDVKPQTLDTKFSATIGEKTVEFPLIRGIFEYNLMSTSDYYTASPFYYSDGYFFTDPAKYDQHLATMSINMAVAAFGRSTNDVGDNKYANHFANVKQMMSDIGCPDENFFANEDYQNKPEFFGQEDRLSTIGVAISHKELVLDDETYTLVPVAIRGGSYEVEWASNVTIGTSGEAEGFSDAANQVTKHINNYLSSYGLEEAAANGKVKFWVVGYSRAGATANLTSKRLVDSYVSKGNQVYGYTFEAPMGGIPIDKSEYNDYNVNGTYPTIHNTVNENDFVTLVAPEEMGFIRYGVDHLIGADYNNNEGTTSEKYVERRNKMAKQLLAINPDFYYDDYWSPATVNPVTSNLPDWLWAFNVGVTIIQEADHYDKNINEEAKNVYTFLRWFFEHVQKDGLDTDNESNFRKYYSSKKFLDKAGWDSGTSDDWENRTLPYDDKNHFFGNSQMSVEQAVQTLMNLMYTLPDDDMEKIMEIVMHNVSNIGDYTMIERFRELIWNFNIHSVDWCADSIDDLIHDLVDPNEKGSIWKILSKEQGEALSEALAPLLYFVCCYASMDYNSYSDSGMWGVGSFVFNMSRLLSNHYQEVSVAWVRSNDSYYDNELQAYKLDTSAIAYSQPEYEYKVSSNTMTLTAEPGSSVFYSIDEGKNWLLYTKPVTFESKPEKIEYFSIYRGIKSDPDSFKTADLMGALIGDGNLWVLLVYSLIIVAGIATMFFVVRKKRSVSIR